jgi:hypothetical protein
VSKEEAVGSISTKNWSGGGGGGGGGDGQLLKVR